MLCFLNSRNDTKITFRNLSSNKLAVLIYISNRSLKLIRKPNFVSLTQPCYMLKLKNSTILKVSILTLLVLLCDSWLLGQTFTKVNDPILNSKNGDWRSIALVDYDNNYTLDIFAGNGGNGNALFANIDYSTFGDSSSLPIITQSNGSSLSFWADVDNDCDQDGFWPVFSGANHFFVNQGNGSFSRSTTGSVITDNFQAFTANWFDYDSDGNIDLFLSNNVGDTNHFYKNNGNLSFSRIDTGDAVLTTGRFWSSNTIDYDNDGDMDIFMSSRASGGKNALLINNGSGWFQYDSTASMINFDSVQTSCWGDYNNDGYVDLFLARREQPNRLFKNNGDGTFTNVSAGVLTSSNYRPGPAIWGDFDNDGFLDIYVTRVSSFSNSNILYHNNGDGTFSVVSTGALGSENFSTEGCNAADINNDGFLDVVNANRFNSPISIFLNNGNNNNYLKLNLVGKSTHRNVTGARVEITSSTGKQTRQLGGSIGWHMDQSLEIHFGLGQDTIVDTLRIFWPGGGACTLTNVPVNSYYNIGQLTCSLDSVPSAEFSDSTRFLTAHFTNLSDGAISSYHWDFGDGQTSTQTSPIHHYTQAGNYEVKLTVFDNFCKKTIIKDSIQICPDTAQLGFSSTNVGQSFSFTDTSISNGYDFQWDFGDGVNANGTNVTHRYSQGGIYTACLYVTDSCRIDTICQTFTVCNDTLEADFGQTNTAYAVAFTDSSINANSILWDFGDGTQDSISTNPIHTYTTPGYYTVCMIVEDDCNIDTLCQTVGICLDTATSGFSFVDNVTTVNFTSSAQHATTHAWDFGDGNTSNSINPNHTYQQPGTYNVCLVVTNDCYTDTLCQTVSVCLNTTQASFNYSDTLTTVSFTSTSAHATSYLWNFGDGSFSTLQNPTYSYQQYGKYVVCLITTNDCGSDTTCKTINVCPKVAVANFSSQHKTGLHMQFYQQCTNAVAYHWDFDDGNYSASANPSYAFNSAWLFNVCLTATDSCGKTDTYCKKIDLTPFSIDELALLELIKVYPNPAKDYVHIELPKELTQNASVTISDVQGKVLATQTLENTATSKLDISQYASGIYIINLQLNGASKQVKVRKE